jgi:hypothetical protein
MSEKWSWRRLFRWRWKAKPPETPVIVGAEYLQHCHEHWSEAQQRFPGYVRANPDGAEMFKAMPPEEIARMSVECFPLFDARPRLR